MKAHNFHSARINSALLKIVSLSREIYPRDLARATGMKAHNSHSARINSVILKIVTPSTEIQLIIEVYTGNLLYFTKGICCISLLNTYTAFWSA